MKVEKLIEELQKMPNNTEVCIADWQKNLYHADDEPNGIGIMPDFNVEYIYENVNAPFIALSFTNDDYSEGGIIESIK